MDEKTNFTHSLSVFIVKPQDLKRAVLFQRSVQVPEFSIDPRNHSVVGQTLAEKIECKESFLRIAAFTFNRVTPFLKMNQEKVISLCLRRWELILITSAAVN